MVPPTVDPHESTALNPMLSHADCDPVAGRYGAIRAIAAAGVNVGTVPAAIVPGSTRSSLKPPPVLLNQPLHRLVPCIGSDEISSPFSPRLWAPNHARHVGASCWLRMATYTPREEITSVDPKFIHRRLPAAADALR